MIEKLLKGILGNWQTTLLGICAALVLILTEIVDLLDSDPNTVFEWEKFWAFGIIALIGIFSKDGNKTSEDVGLNQ